MNTIENNTQQNIHLLINFLTDRIDLENKEIEKIYENLSEENRTELYDSYVLKYIVFTDENIADTDQKNTL